MRVKSTVVLALTLLIIHIADANSCVDVNPSAKLQAVVNANPEGTSFCLEEGVYNLESEVSPKPRNSFIGVPGKSILRGNGTAKAFAGYGGWPQSVEIRDLVFEKFDTAIKTTTGWIVEGSEFRHNRIGLTVNGDNVVIRRNYIHHNKQYGMTGSSANKGLVELNEIAHNNDGTSWEGDSGGTKFIRSDGLILRNNFVHHNIGPGLWCDGNNINILYDGNIVEHNTGPGIFHEISHDAVIRNNIVRFNASETVAGRSIWWGSNIHLNGGKNVEIYDNMVESDGQSNAIGIVNTPRGSGWYGKWESRNVYVHGNSIEMAREASTGFAGDSDVNQNIRFIKNRYTLPDLAGKHWFWNAEMTKSQWQEKGHDKQGDFVATKMCR